MVKPFLIPTAEEQELLSDIVTKLEPLQAELAREAADIVSESTELDERYLPAAERQQIMANLFAGFLASARAGSVESLDATRAQRMRYAVEQGIAFPNSVLGLLVLQELMLSLLPQLCGDDPQRLAQAAAAITKACNSIYITCADFYLAEKEEVINDQQQAMLQLSTPVIQVWEGILVAPLVGAIDSERAMQITQTLLNMVRDTKASIAIIDISGVPMVDTLVANHLLKTVRAARLLGAKCLIVGISPEIAETLINLGVDLSGIDTHFSLHTGLKQAFRELGVAVSTA